MTKPIFIGFYDEDFEEVFINANAIVSFKQDENIVAIKMVNGDSVHVIAHPDFDFAENSTAYEFCDLLISAIERITHEKSDSKKT